MQLCWIWLWGGFVRSWFVMNFKRWYGEGKEAGRQVDLSPTPLQTHGKEPGRRAIGACKLHALCAPTTTARTYWCRPQALVGNACPHCTSAIISFVWASPPFIPPLNHKAQVYEHHDWWYSLTMLLWIPLSPLASSNSLHACYFLSFRAATRMKPCIREPACLPCYGSIWPEPFMVYVIAEELWILCHIISLD